MIKSNIFLISGWLAVSYKEYEKLYIDAFFNNATDSKDGFYSVAKYIADERNDTTVSAEDFKKKMLKNKYYEPLIDFIQTYYDIMQSYN